MLNGYLTDVSKSTLRLSILNKNWSFPAKEHLPTLPTLNIYPNYPLQCTIIETNLGFTSYWDQHHSLYAGHNWFAAICLLGLISLGMCCWTQLWATLCSLAVVLLYLTTPLGIEFMAVLWTIFNILQIKGLVQNYWTTLFFCKKLQ